MKIYDKDLAELIEYRGFKGQHMEYWIFDDEAKSAIAQIEEECDRDSLLLALRLKDNKIE